jgi:hypothetical protein
MLRNVKVAEVDQRTKDREVVHQTDSPDLWTNGGGTRRSVTTLHYATKPEGSWPDEVKELFPIYLILPAPLGPGVYSVSNRNGYRQQTNNVSWGKGWAVRRADNLIAICKPAA